MGLKLSDVSPIASLIKGEGLIEHAGIIPSLLTRRQDDKREAREKLAKEAEAAEKLKLKATIDGAAKMRSGGRTRSKPIDGVAIRGKTKGRFV
jgi:hypothetical protein